MINRTKSKIRFHHSEGRFNLGQSPIRPYDRSKIPILETGSQNVAFTGRDPILMSWKPRHRNGLGILRPVLPRDLNII